MLPREYIYKFCAVSDPRLWLMRPARDMGKLYASNGHIMIQTVDDDPGVNAMTDSPLVGAVQRLMAQGEGRGNWLPVDMTLPARTLCGPCRGTGQLQSCVRCDGEGDIDPDEDGIPQQTCPECNGRGEWPDVNGAPCRYCDGTGEGYLPLSFGNTYFQRRYLALLQGLPGPVALAHDVVPSGVAYFRFPGGQGALMPCRGQSCGPT